MAHGGRRSVRRRRRVAVVRRDVVLDVPHAPVDARGLLLRHHRARHHEPHARHVRAQLRDREGGRERGWRPVAAAGAALLVAAGAAMRDGGSVAHYAGGQLTLGVAWNLCFVAATAEVGRVSLHVSASLGGSCCGAARRARRTQAAADVATFAAAAARASVASGAALAAVGWNDMQIVGWACAGPMLCAVGVSTVAATDGGDEAFDREGDRDQGDDTPGVDALAELRTFKIDFNYLHLSFKPSVRSSATSSRPPHAARPSAQSPSFALHSTGASSCGQCPATTGA